MRKTWIIFGLAIACSILVVPSYRKLAAQAPPDHPAIPIGVSQVFLTNAQLNPDENFQVIRAFVPTGSESQKCLATLNETNFAPFGTILFCGERAPSSFGTGPGVLISVFFPEPPASDFNLNISVNVYQEGAVRYGTPILCRNQDGC
jgi:hypothetical protein